MNLGGKSCYFSRTTLHPQLLAFLSNKAIEAGGNPSEESCKYNRLVGRLAPGCGTQPFERSNPVF